MAQIDTSTIAYQLKRVYGDRITDLFKRQTMTYNMFSKSNRKASYSVGGSGYYFSTRQGDIESIGARAENKYLPEPLAGDGVQGVITPRLEYGVLRLSGLAIEAGKGNTQAFVDVQGDAVKNVYKSLVQDLNRQCWGDGFGELGTSSAAGTPDTTGTWTVTFDNDRGVRYMKKGMICDFFNTAGTAIDESASSVRIQSINPNTRVVTFESAADAYKAYHPESDTTRGYSNAESAIPSGSILVRYGAREASHATSDTSKELLGILAAYDDGTLLATYEGITVASDPEFKANQLLNSGTGRELTIDLMLAAMDMTSTRSDESVDFIRMGLGQRRKYFGLLASDVRYNAGQFLGGYESLDFAQNARVKMIVDPVTQPNKMFFEPDGCIKKYELTPIGWGGLDGLKMHWRQDYDQATMFLRTYTNLGVEKRNALTLLGDLTEPTGTTMPW